MFSFPVADLIFAGVVIGATTTVMPSLLQRFLRTRFANRVRQVINIALDLRAYRKAIRRPLEKETELDPYNREILMLVMSDLRVDPRVRRQAQALAARNFKVTIYYIDIFSPPGGPKIEIDYGPGISTHALPQYLAAYTAAFPFILSREYVELIKQLRPFAIHCHDAPQAMTGLMLARHSGAHWVVDFHEWYSENVTWWQAGGRYVAHPKRVAWVYRQLERLVTRHAAATITVCETIAASLEKDHTSGQPKHVHVIRNVPESKRAPTRVYADIRQELGLPADSFVVLYQGGVGPTRNVEAVVESLRHTAENVHLVVRGPAVEIYGERYSLIARQSGAGHRLHCRTSVPSTDVIEASRGADVGIYTVAGICKSFTAALPNKLFEYMYADLPILTAHYPEARNFVEKHGVGLAFDPEDPKSIAAAIMHMRDDDDFREGCRARIPAALELIDADREWHRLADIYEDLYNHVPKEKRRVFGRDDGLVG